MGVRVGIVSWNTRDLLGRCLAALPQALGDLDATVVVVDNDSADDSAALAAGTGVNVIRNSANVGYARAMNQALTTPMGDESEILIALNPDTVPAADSLAELVRRLRAQPDVGLVVPRLRHANGELQHSVYRFPSAKLAAVVCFVPRRWQRGAIGRRWWLEGFAPHDEPVDIDWAIGAVHVIRASALEGKLPYSERWFMYVEDLDLCWRLARTRWRRRLEADVDVIHIGNAAGAQAWGSERTARWLDASYDWYQLVHGKMAARWWAAVNTAGVLTLLAAGSVISSYRALAGGLRAMLPIHLHVLLHGRARINHASPSDSTP
jgi:GT2 family glycosyltransferase